MLLRADVHRRGPAGRGGDDRHRLRAVLHVRESVPERAAARRTERAVRADGSTSGDRRVNINLTLIVQMIVFALLIWVTMKFVWPMILGADGRAATKIAQGLAAAEQGEQELAAGARARRRDRARGARARQPDHRPGAAPRQRAGGAGQGHAQHRRRAHGGRRAAADRARDHARAREPAARSRRASRWTAAAKLLEREIDARAHADLLDKLAAQI